jgi:cation:H+ antiporter
VYSFSLPLRASISPVDSVVLIALFVVYASLAARQPAEEPHLVGPAAMLGSLPTGPRRLAILALFAFAGGAIGVSAEPFADGLVHTGARLGVDEFLLVQWLAPLASEAPEFLVAALLAVRGKGVAALTLLLSAKVNQWTLLVGSLPLAFSWGAGHLAALPLDARQTSEVLLTAAQGLFGIAVLASLSFELSEAVLLASLFVVQFAVGGLLRALLHESDAATAELHLVSAIYIGLSLLFLVRARRTLLRLLRGERTLVEPAELDPPAERRHAA